MSLDEKLLARFDEQIQEEGYPTRSKAVADLISNSLIKQEWQSGQEVAAAIIMIYDHHKRGLTNTLTRIQHDYHHIIIASQHIHLDHDNCLEIVVVKGNPQPIRKLTEQLKGTKGVKHTSLAAASTGKKL